MGIYSPDDFPQYGWMEPVNRPDRELAKFLKANFRHYPSPSPDRPLTYCKLMIQIDSRAAAYADVLRKVFDLGGPGLSRPLAEDILSLDFPQQDADRAAELSAKANEGTLTEGEEAELEAYINVGDLLAFWQLKARRLLQHGA